MFKPIAADLPYPSLDGIAKDLTAANIIAPAYASGGSEITAIMQYLYHHFRFYGEQMEFYAETLEEIAVTEMHHLDILGKLLLNLGVDPVFTARPPMRCDWYNTSVILYSTYPQKMIMDDISAEMKAIEMYESMVMRLNNQQVAAIIERIILDERLHVKTLSELLKKLPTERKK